MDCGCSATNVSTGKEEECGCMSCAVGRAQAWTLARQGGGVTTKAQPTPSIPAARRAQSKPLSVLDFARSQRRRAQRRSAPTSSFAAAAAAYEWDDGFPKGETPCHWMLEAVAVPLLDPMPCTDRSGVVESEILPWALHAGTTQTTLLPSGVYRMYFGSASLQRALTDKFPDAWPIYDFGDRVKFAIDPEGDAYAEGTAEFDAFWAATGSAYPNLYFSPNFIGYLDSADGVHFPMYAPAVSPTSGTTCENVKYNGAAGVLDDAATGFRAGWRSTSIPASGASLVYRDASVVYLAELARYLMFAVECDGAGQAPDGFGGNVTDVAGCLCVPSGDLNPDNWAVKNDDPKTRFVFFTCIDADFGANTKGPFPVAPEPPDFNLGQWIGVPQAFLSPDRRYLLFYIGNRSYFFAGMHVARVSELVADVTLLESRLAVGSDVSSLGDLFYRHFVNLGVVNVACANPSTPTTRPTPTPTDEQFMFDPDGRLHLYFTDRDGTDADGSGDGEDDPLRIVSHAVSLVAWDSDVIDGLLDAAADEPVGLSLVDDSEWRDSVRQDPCHFQKLLGLACVDFHGSGAGGLDHPDVATATGPNMLANFKMASCDPVWMSLQLGGTSVLDGHGISQSVEVNDPNVYLAATGQYVMILNCSVLGGLVRMTADDATACSTDTQCY